MKKQTAGRNIRYTPLKEERKIEIQNDCNRCKVIIPKENFHKDKRTERDLKQIEDKPIFINMNLQVITLN